MNLSFLRYFKMGKAASAAVAVAPAPVSPIDKPASDRFGKTVMPNSSRIVGLEPARNLPVPGTGPSPVSGVPLAHRKISLGGNGSIGVVPKGPSNESVGLPPGERTIALQLVDLVPHIPAGVLRPAQIDPQHRVVLRASELELGMSRGRPTVLLRSIYQQAPEFFVSEVAETDKIEVVLPFGKVLEQFANFQVRDDQVCDHTVPQVETPFLKVTQEDSERFKTSLAPLQSSGRPAVPMEPPAAPPVPARPPKPPEAAAETKPVTAIRFPAPNETGSKVAAAAPAQAPIRLDPPPARPPLSATISPNGTGVSASERVPASSGPPVLTPSSSPSAPPAPARIPLKISPPANDLPPPLAAKGKAAGAEEEIEFSSKGSRIRLPLRNLLRGIPSFQLSGPTDEVPEATMIEFPFSIVEPQLALGRIAVSPAQFHGAIPAEFRNRFKIEDSATPISLPLQEVLQNLPNEALQIRGDQQEIEVLELIETPFSQKATEDATRMKVPTGPVVRPAVSFAEPEPEPAAAPAKKAPVAAVPKVKAVAAAIKAPSAATPEGRTALQKMLETDEALDAKAVVARASSLPGVSACAIVFSDGLSLAGNIPADYEADALCAIAPAIVKRIGEQMLGANLGSLTAVTLFCAKTPVSFFAHGNICLAALHSADEIAAETRTRLGRIAQELARMYAESA